MANEQNRNFDWVRLIGIAVVLAIVIWVSLRAGAGMDKLKVAIGYGLLFLVLLLGLAVLIDILKGSIDLSQLLDEVDGGASMSRFQLLIFTFVIALSFFMIVVSKEDFPSVPAEVLALLGISATTYGVSKGIQMASQPQASDQQPPNPPPANQPAANQPANQPQQPQ